MSLVSHPFGRVARFALAAASVILILGWTANSATSCPFCSAPSQTLTEQVAQADGICLVQWLSAQPAKDQDSGSSSYQVLQVLKSPLESVKKGDKISLARFRAGKKGDLFMLMGTRAGRGNEIEWGSPTEVTETAFNYVAQAPSTEVPATKRLAYFVKFLEFPDSMISTDAYAEFANAPYKDIASVSHLLPHDKICKWISNPDTPPNRMGLYGLLLGLCGNEKDANVLGAKIAEKSADFRIGIDGLISGYLLLTGDAGLANIDKWKFRDQQVPFSETYAAMMGLRFMWQYAGGKIPNERLMQSMRLLLDRPELADLVIADLSRWNDWSVQDRLMSLYGKGAYNIPSIKRAIIRYMLASAQAKPANGTPTPEPKAKTADAAQTVFAQVRPENGTAEHGTGSNGTYSSGKPINGTQTASADPATRGKKYVDELRHKDPRMVKEAERFFFVN